MEDRYSCLGDGPRIELKVKGSRFLGQAFAVRDEAEAMRRLDALRRREYDATHHCWALRVGEPEQLLERFDDDGEPSGSAGRPILGALLREKLSDGLVVVTRYFGGTKLGTGGLVRAYGEAAAEAIAQAPHHIRHLTATLRVACSFDDLGTVEATLHRFADVIRAVEREFDPTPRLRLSVLRSRAPALRAQLVEDSAGRVRFDEG